MLSCCYISLSLHYPLEKLRLIFYNPPDQQALLIVHLFQPTCRLR